MCKKLFCILIFGTLMLLVSPRCYAIYPHIEVDGRNVTVTPSATDKEKELELSLDGGKNFFRIGKNGTTIRNLLPDTYYICMRYKGRPTTVSDTYSAYVSEEEHPVKLSVTGVRERTYKSGAIKISITNYDRDKKYIVSLDGGHSWYRMKSRSVARSGVGGGEYNVIVKVMGSEDYSGTIGVMVPYPVNRGYMNIGAPLILQNPELPTGCEITSLTMALKFMGFNVDKVTLADWFLEKAPYRTADYRKKFVGDPKTYMAYGCFAPVIEKSAHKFLDGVGNKKFEIRNISGCSFDKVRSFIDMGYPVIIWGTIDMAPAGTGAAWIDKESGSTITWVANEHCMLMTGYDLGHHQIFVNDPLRGRVAYDENTFIERFNQLESQAIVIIDVTE